MKKVLLVVAMVLLLTGCNNSEDNAKQTAEDYMDAVKNGNEFENIDLIEGFIDVFNYEYLQTLETEKVKDTITFDRNAWEMSFQDEHPTFEDYKNNNKELFSDYEVLTDNDNELEIWDGETYNNIYTLLYNVEIANEQGEKIFKKAEITVKEFEDDYVITDIYLR